MARLEGPLASRDRAAVAEAVTRSLRVKAAVVTADVFETTGVRAALNLGHTAGHALETASGRRLQHGEAVAWGLLAALRLSVARAGLAPASADALAARVLALARPPRPRPADVRAVLRLLAADKKADRRGLVAVLLERPGSVRLVRVAAPEVAAALREALARYN
jgi:3-dehydroquinate synthase